MRQPGREGRPQARGGIVTPGLSAAGGKKQCQGKVLRPWGSLLMWLTSALVHLRSGRSRGRGTPPRRCRPGVEALDGRLLPSFTPLGAFPVGSNPQSVAVADFDRDGKQDLAVANVSSNSDTVSIFQGLGAVGFRAAPDVPVGS